jgi:mannosyl-3-phosphoglycerate phosphatase
MAAFFCYSGYGRRGSIRSGSDDGYGGLIMKVPAIFFSDLDGTLLDADTYGYEPARPAIEALAEAGIPLVFCTSKTRLETERWRRTLSNIHPFIIENGGAVFIPEGYFGIDVSYARRDCGYGILEFGRPYAELRRTLDEIRASTGLPLRGFGDMAVDEIAERCGFTLDDAMRAAAREYDEPFVGADRDVLPGVVQEAEKHGLQVVSGGLFHHLVGGSDKGRAVRALRSLYEAGRGPVTAVGLGDSANDEPMLRAVDIPILIRRPDGSHLKPVDMPGLIIASHPGPEGWREVVFMIIRRLS